MHLVGKSRMNGFGSLTISNLWKLVGEVRETSCKPIKGIWWYGGVILEDWVVRQAANHNKIQFYLVSPSCFYWSF